jgi:anti-sigma regulatory factor (Ser/Thr protein kinase)
VSLVIWELITNAVIHGRPPADLDARLLEHTLRIEVADADPRPPMLVTEPSSAGGYGLHIVQGVSARWGWKPLASGKVVWAEVNKP